MKKFLGLVIASTFLICACDESPTAKFGVVDMNRLMRESVPGKAGLKFIEEQQTRLQSELDAIQDKLEKNPGDENAIQELQKVYSVSQQKIQTEGQRVVTILFDSIQNTLNTYRERNGYAALIRTEALDSYDPSMDITNAVMTEVDMLKLEFEPAREQSDNSSAAEKKAETQEETGNQ